MFSGEGGRDICDGKRPHHNGGDKLRRAVAGLVCCTIRVDRRAGNSHRVHTHHLVLLLPPRRLLPLARPVHDKRVYSYISALEKTRPTQQYSLGTCHFKRESFGGPCHGYIYALIDGRKSAPDLYRSSDIPCDLTMRPKQIGKPLSQNLQERIKAAQAQALASSALVAPWLARGAPIGGAGLPLVPPDPLTSRPSEDRPQAPERAPADGSGPPDSPSFFVRFSIGYSNPLGEAPADPSLMPEADRSEREGDPPQTSGPAETTARKTFRPGRGKPLHLLFGRDVEGEPEPSRLPPADGSRHGSESAQAEIEIVPDAEMTAQEEIAPAEKEKVPVLSEKEIADRILLSEIAVKVCLEDLTSPVIARFLEGIITSYLNESWEMVKYEDIIKEDLTAQIIAVVVEADPSVLDTQVDPELESFLDNKEDESEKDEVKVDSPVLSLEEAQARAAWELRVQSLKEKEKDLQIEKSTIWDDSPGLDLDSLLALDAMEEEREKSASKLKEKAGIDPKSKDFQHWMRFSKNQQKEEKGLRGMILLSQDGLPEPQPRQGYQSSQSKSFSSSQRQMKETVVQRPTFSPPPSPKKRMSSPSPVQTEEIVSKVIQDKIADAASPEPMYENPELDPNFRMARFQELVGAAQIRKARAEGKDTTGLTTMSAYRKKEFEKFQVNPEIFDPSKYMEKHPEAVVPRATELKIIGSSTQSSFEEEEEEDSCLKIFDFIIYFLPVAFPSELSEEFSALKQDFTWTSLSQGEP
ncbi:hypothetical protein KSP39_PZI000292 [Platanthera zijinensis]|uniref:Uncharacterized protein n=1 Tax=Platanthera zijinensis TaxID=2320716 RepID=A0AAP0GG91_9ASPA